MTRSSFPFFVIILLAGGLALAPVLSLAQDEAEEPREKSPLNEVTAEEAIERFEAPQGVLAVGDDTYTMDELLKSFRLPGLSVAVIYNGEVHWAKAYGVRDAKSREPLETDTAMPAASLTKTVTAFGVVRVHDSGKGDIYAPINSQLKTWGLPENEYTKARPVTAELLLRHRGGVNNKSLTPYSHHVFWPNTIQILEGSYRATNDAVRVVQPVGEREKYSSGGYMILQVFVEDNVGRPFPEAMDELVFDPLGMTRSAYAPTPGEALGSNIAHGHDGLGILRGEPYLVYPELAAGGLWTTPTDLAKLLIELQKAYKGESELLSQEMAQKMLTLQGDSRYGYGVTVKRRGKDHIYFGHDGNLWGFDTSMWAHLEDGFGAVILTNGDAGKAVAREVLGRIAGVYNWPGYRKPRNIQVVDEENSTGDATSPDAN